jgi:hypothetical protein
MFVNLGRVDGKSCLLDIVLLMTDDDDAYLNLDVTLFFPSTETPENRGDRRTTKAVYRTKLAK